MTKAVIFDLDGVIADSLKTMHEFLGFLCRRSRRPYEIEGEEIKTPTQLRSVWEEPYFLMYEKLGYNWARKRQREMVIRNYIIFF